MNAGRILSEGFVNQLTEPLLPTLLFYIKNSTWEEVLACLQQKDEDSKVNNNFTVLHRVYALLKAYRHVTPCPYKMVLCGRQEHGSLLRISLNPKERGK